MLLQLCLYYEVNKLGFSLRRIYFLMCESSSLCSSFRITFRFFGNKFDLCNTILPKQNTSVNKFWNWCTKFLLPCGLEIQYNFNCGEGHGKYFSKWKGQFRMERTTRYFLSHKLLNLYQKMTGCLTCVSQKDNYYQQILENSLAVKQ